MPQLRIKNGPEKGKIIPLILNKPLIIGREESCGLQIVDKGVSREHAEIFRVGEMIFVRDLTSRNGSFLNEEKIKEDLLREGDTLRVGNTQMVFESRRVAREQGRDLQFDDSEGFKTSLDLKVDDLYVMHDGSNSHSDNDLFKAICQAMLIVQGERDERKLFQRMLDLLFEHIPADHLYLFVRDEVTGTITPRASRQKGSETNIPISRTILRRVISEARAILTADAMQDDRFKADDSIVMNKIRSVLCVPILANNQTVGAIYAVNSSLADTFEQHDLQMVTAIGGQLALSIENLSQVRSRRRMFMQTIGQLVALLEGGNPGRLGHAERVSIYAGAIAAKMGLSDNEVLYFGVAGLLHDIGKAPAVAALAKNTGDERTRHVAAAVEFLREIPGMHEAIPAIESHHERFDGSGFPKKLKSDDIPLGGRILAVATDLDRLIFPPGKPLPDGEPDAALVRVAFTDLDAQSGKLYDPAVVKAVMVAYRHGLLRPITREGSVSGERTQLMKDRKPPVIAPAPAESSQAAPAVTPARPTSETARTTVPVDKPEPEKK